MGWGGGVKSAQGVGREGEIVSRDPVTGDSVVIPERMFKPGFLRGLRDWTQVFSPLALGAAAINVIR
jgi:hypothetical protein